jgi:SAM-dependent methyltransferase
VPGDARHRHLRRDGQAGEERLAHLANVHLWHGNGYDLEVFEGDQFDLVYCGLVLQHMPKTTVYNYLLETHRVLKPQGRFRFQVPNILATSSSTSSGTFTQPYFVHHPYPMHFYSPAEIVQLATKAGFWVEELDGDILVQARKREQAGVAPAIAERDDLSLLEGDTLIGLRERFNERNEHNRHLEQRVLELEEGLERIRRHPVVRIGRLIRNGLRRVRP